jgi:regulator of replication initiation timing
MTDKIQQIIDEISRKTKVLHHQLVEERLKNEQLRLENVDLREQLMSTTSQMERLDLEVGRLKEDLVSAKKQVVEVPVTAGSVSNEEIDELVKEIEYCISQLKK